MNDIYLVNKNVEKIIRGNSTNFLDLKIQNMIKRKLGKEKYKVYSPYKDSEKVIFYTSERPNVLLYEIKSSIILKHQEIMGTLFSLGIDTSLYGDILIIDNHYYIYILDILENYLLSNLTMIKNSRVELEKRDIEYLSDYERKYEIIEIIVSSERIDTVTAHLIHTNRQEIIKKIRNKEVLVNYDYPKNSCILKENDVFSVRKYGKYKYIGIVNKTKKNNIVVRVFKYL